MSHSISDYNTPVVTPQLIEGYVAQARQAYVSSKEAAARAAAYIYLTWAATLSPWARKADAGDMATAIRDYDQGIAGFNAALVALEGNAKKFKAKLLSAEELDTKPNLPTGYAAEYAGYLARIRAGKAFEAKAHRKVGAANTREDASAFAPLVKYVLGLDRPEDSSTAARYVAVVSFLHSRCATSTPDDASDLIRLIDGIGGFERAVQWTRGNKAAATKPASGKADKAKAIADQVKAALRDAPSKGRVTMEVDGTGDGLIVLVGRCDGGGVEVLGELPVADRDAVISTFHDDGLFPVEPMVGFMGRVLALGRLVEEGRLTGRTVEGTKAGEKQKEQRTLSLVPLDDGGVQAVVSALYADASVVVRATPHGAEINLGSVPCAMSMEREDFRALEEDVIDPVERRLVSLSARGQGGGLIWTLRNSALVKADGTGGTRELAWTNLAGRYLTPLTVDGFRPRFKATITKADITALLGKRYAAGGATGKATASTEPFDMEFVGDAFSPRIMVEVGAPGGGGSAEPVGIRCREADAHGLLLALAAQGSGSFTFEGDPRGLLSVTWSDALGYYEVFIPSRTAEGGLNPSRLAPIDAEASEEPKAA
jgi:hypothetical protein